MSSNSELLRQASASITQVMKRLNNKSKKCNECGCLVYEDKKAFQSAKELEAIVRKLRRFEQEMKEKVNDK